MNKLESATRLMLCVLIGLSASACNAKQAKPQPEIAICVVEQKEFKTKELLPCGSKIQALVNLCTANLEAQQLDVAAKQCNEIIELTPAHLEKGQVLANEYKRQAYVYNGSGYYKESVQALNKFFELANQNLSLYDPERMLDAKLVLGASYQGLENYDEAIRLYNESIDYTRDSFGTNSEKALLPESFIAQIYYVQDKFEESEKRFLSVVKVAENSGNPSDGFVSSALFLAYQNLGELYLKQNKLKASEFYLMKAYNQLNERFGENTNEHIATVDTLGKVYELMGDVENEKKFKKIFSEISEKYNLIRKTDQPSSK